MSRDVTPIPDPTKLTTDQLTHEIDQLKQFLESKIDQLRIMVDGHMALDLERHAGIALRFAEEEVRRNREVDEARKTQQASAEKMEANLIKLIDGVVSTYNVGHASLVASVGSMEIRVARMEAMKQGGQEKEQEHGRYVSATQAMIGLSITILLALMAVFGFLATQLK